jgi:hypothetical protein
MLFGFDEDLVVLNEESNKEKRLSQNHHLPPSFIFMYMYVCIDSMYMFHFIFFFLFFFFFHFP